jgi:hypothetical protein
MTHPQTNESAKMPLPRTQESVIAGQTGLQSDFSMAASLLGLQRSHGNRFVQRVIQSKLEFIRRGDQSESQASVEVTAPETPTLLRANDGVLFRDTNNPGQAPAACWDPPHLYEGDGLVPVTDYLQARNNLQCLAWDLKPPAEAGFAEAQLVLKQVEAKLKALPAQGNLTEDDASKLKGLGMAALGAYNVGFSRMQEALNKSLSQYKEPAGFDEAKQESAERVHEAFGEDEKVLAKAKQASEYVHVAEENLHYAIEWAEESLKELTMIKHWYVEPAEHSFEHIIEGFGKVMPWIIAVHGALNAASAIGGATEAAHDSSKSTAQKGAAGIEAGVASVSAIAGGAALIGIQGAANIGLIWANLIVPQTQLCLKALERLDKTAARGARELLADEFYTAAQGGGGPPTLPKDPQNWFPGGQATLNYMWAVFLGKPPDDAPAEVTKFFYENRKKMNAEHGDSEQLDTEWHLFRPDEVKNLKEWVLEHKVEVWEMLYGGLPHPG